jgi:hypothetical protein
MSRAISVASLGLPFPPDVETDGHRGNRATMLRTVLTSRMVISVKEKQEISMVRKHSISPATCWRLTARRRDKPSMRFAAIADIHGNYLALQAVIADIRAQGVDGIVNLGDMTSGPLVALDQLPRL